jgi:cytochrome c oxidase assembly protein subunit 19
MLEYLACLKKVRGTNYHECRMIAKSYLQCRMERELMARDEMVNLGFGEDGAEGTGKNKTNDLGSEWKGKVDRLEELKRENRRLVEERERREKANGDGL